MKAVLYTATMRLCLILIDGPMAPVRRHRVQDTCRSGSVDGFALEESSPFLVWSIRDTPHESDFLLPLDNRN